MKAEKHNTVSRELDARMMAEIALSKFLKDHYNIEIKLDFTVRNVVVGQDITEVVRGRVANPPRVRISVKSGKENGMILIVPEPEVENARGYQTTMYLLGSYIQTTSS